MIAARAYAVCIKTPETCNRKLRHARRIRPEVPGHLAYVVEGHTVVEVESSPRPAEHTVYRGCDQGSAHAVAQALAAYWASRGLLLRPRRDAYSATVLRGAKEKS